jgi:hypothetical protein
MAASPLPTRAARRRRACPCSGSSPAGRSSAGGRSWRSAGSTARSGSEARRSSSHSTSPPPGWLLRYVPEVVAHHHPAARPPQAGAARRRRQLRNELWTAWLRAPAADAAGRTARVAVRDPAVLAAAMRGVPWIARERRPVDRALARRRAALGSSAAR